MINYDKESYGTKGFAVVDGLLSPEELDELRWWGYVGRKENHYKGGYWGIADVKDKCEAYRNLSQRFINEIDILKGKEYYSGWIFVYNNKCDGITPHADPAATNINVWITPDHCVEDANKNGLIIYRKKAPADWSYKDYNENVPKIRSLLEGADKQEIKYKCNRMMMFDSNRFHETNGVCMKEGEWNRRMNVTFMFK